MTQAELMTIDAMWAHMSLTVATVISVNERFQSLHVTQPQTADDINYHTASGKLHYITLRYIRVI